MEQQTNHQAININQEKKCSFIKHIKIRVGEPLTAIYISQKGICFGAISGYVGYYDFEKKTLDYCQEVFEEIIRGIYIKDATNIANVAIGDYALMELDLQDLTRCKKHIYDSHETKKPTQCAATVTFLSKFSVANLIASPTINRDKEDYEQINKDKKEIVVYTMYKDNYAQQDQEEEDDDDIVGDIKNYKVENVPDVYVPFDFDGLNLLWMEYQENGIKSFQKYKMETKFLQKDILVFDKKTRFISHLKLCRNYIIYVIEHQHVKAYDCKTKKTTDLFSHNSAIQAMDVKCTKYINDQSYDLEKQQQIADEVPHVEYDDIDLKDITIASVDYKVNLKLFQNGQMHQEENLLKIKGLPEEIKNHGYIFDMGYPYYLSLRQQKVAFTSDLGVLSFQL